MKADLQNEQDEPRKTGGHILDIVLEKENEKKKDLEVMLTLMEGKWLQEYSKKAHNSL